MIRLPKNHILEIVKRLRFPRVIKDLIRDSSQLWRDLQGFSNATSSDYLIRLEKTPNLVIYCTYLAIDDSEITAALKNFVTKWKDIQPHTTGHDLAAQGLQPGPAFKEILTELQIAWIEEIVKNQAQELEFLETILVNYR